MKLAIARAIQGISWVVLMLAVASIGLLLCWIMLQNLWKMMALCAAVILMTRILVWADHVIEDYEALEKEK